MKYITLILLGLLLFSCNAQHPSKISTEALLIYKDSVAHNDNFVYVNEVFLNTTDKSSKGVVSQIQDLSENKWLTATLPKERLSKKLEALKECIAKNTGDCGYVSEGYEIISDLNGLINIAYSYNQLGSADTYFKYGCYDLRSEKRMVLVDLFKEPQSFLKDFNKKYFSRLTDELANYSEGEDQEFEMITDYIEIKEPFHLSELDNFELVLQNTRFTAIRFHYNGLGGNYRSIIPNGYIEYSIKELEPQLKKSFLNRLN